MVIIIHYYYQLVLSDVSNIVCNKCTNDVISEDYSVIKSFCDTHNWENTHLHVYDRLPESRCNIVCVCVCVYVRVCDLTMILWCFREYFILQHFVCLGVFKNLFNYIHIPPHMSKELIYKNPKNPWKQKPLQS